ncbi:MAG: tryptophan--tRNA ligase [Eubacteriales bacterium]|nr:tryptophan--tRNA ligase [Eubacteriales bacterium]
MFKEQKVLLSGIQPTGIMTIGNYIGAVKNWLKLQDDCLSVYFIADLHALTVKQDPTEFRQRATSFFAQYLAFGLDPEKSILYFQSHVPEHTQLSWALNCFTYIGEAQRMTQFKDKCAKHQDNINMGLMDYPVLMAADILLYQTDLVPVGIDQKQHLELTRDIAMRFNNRFGDVFTVPDGYIPKQGAKIMSLQDPLSKMSKSDPDVNAAVSVIEDADSIMRKFKRAVTDSGNEIVFREDKPGISNLLSIYSEMTGKTIKEAELEFEGKGYGDFKKAVGESVVEKLRPVKEEYDHIIKDKAYILETAKKGAEKARYIASRTIKKVYKKLGLVLQD